MMRSFSLFLFVPVLIAGCATSASPPATSASASVPSTSQTDGAHHRHPVRIATQMFIRLPKGWHITQLKSGLMAAVDPDENAVVAIDIKTDPTESVVAMVRKCRMNVVRQFNDIVFPIYRREGSGMVGFKYLTLVDGAVQQGAVIARPSNMEGINVGFSGLWPKDLNKVVIPQYEQIVESTVLR